MFYFLISCLLISECITYDPLTNVNLSYEYGEIEQGREGNSSHDCSGRGIVRQDPLGCYEFQFDTNKLERIWWTFWYEIRNDLAYTFDFVLTPREDDDRTSFYYIVKFLKSLVEHIHKPSDVLCQDNYNKDIYDIKNEFLGALNEVNNYAHNYNRFKNEYEDIFTDFGAVKKNSIEMRTKIYEIKTTLTRSDIQSTMLEDKVDSMNIKLNGIKNVITLFPESIRLTTLGKENENVSGVNIPDHPAAAKTAQPVISQQPEFPIVLKQSGSQSSAHAGQGLARQEPEKIVYYEYDMPVEESSAEMCEKCISQVGSVSPIQYPKPADKKIEKNVKKIKLQTQEPLMYQNIEDIMMAGNIVFDVEHHSGRDPTKSEQKELQKKLKERPWGR